jgi:hypothetical protein
MTLLVSSPVYSQLATPLSAPTQASFPGAYESLEKLISFDQIRFEAKQKTLSRSKQTLDELKTVETIDIDPDLLNSLTLNTPTGYLKLAAKNRCAFYHVLIADLFKHSKGKLQEVFIQYQSSGGQNISALVSKQDFLNKVVLKACPEANDMIAKFQLKVIDQTIKETNFEIPSNSPQCQQAYNAWINDSKSPYWCQIHELITDPDLTSGVRMSDPVQQRALESRRSVANVLQGKLSNSQKEYINNFCTNADNQAKFCEGFFRVNFFAKIAEMKRNADFIKDICQEAMQTKVWSPAVINECVQKLNTNQEACMWGDIEGSGLSPRPLCYHLSLAMSEAVLSADYNDCPRYSDHTGVTNMGRILRHIDNKQPLAPIKGFCATQSAGSVYEFNKRYDNEEIWTSAMCYMDRVDEIEKCLPVFYGDYGVSEASLTSVVNEILFRTKGAGRDTKCTIVKKSDWNPNLLEYRYGCQVVVDEENCGIGRCNYKIMFNEKEIKGLKVKEGLAFDYFPNDLMREKYSQTYILQKDALKKMKILNTLPGMRKFFRENPKALVHGMGCAEDLQPSFFKKTSFNQCTPLPFIIDGIVNTNDRSALVVRSAADNIRAPRLISWSYVYSAVRSYIASHPIKQWTMYGVY